MTIQSSTSWEQGPEINHIPGYNVLKHFVVSDCSSVWKDGDTDANLVFRTICKKHGICLFRSCVQKTKRHLKKKLKIN